MIVYSFLSFSAFIIYLWIGLYAYKLNSKSKVNVVFLNLCISMAIWSFTYAFVYMAVDVYTYSFWNKIGAIGWCTFSAIILDLVLHITKSKLINNKFVRTIIYAPALIFLYSAVFLFYPNVQTNYVIEQFFYKGNFLYNFGYLLGSILIIHRWGRLSNINAEKVQARIIVITASIPFLLNLMSQYIPSLLGFKYVPSIGQIYMLITILGVYYIIVRYGFLQVANSVLAEEMLTEVMDLTFILDAEGKITKVSKHTLVLLGYSSEELINNPITFVLKDNVISDMYENIRWGKSVTRFKEVQCLDKSGELIPISVSCTPILNSKYDRLIGVLIVGQDIRILKELNNEIRVHQETAEKLKNSEEIFRVMVETIPLGLVLTRKIDGKIIYINSNTEKLFGVIQEEVLEKTTEDYYFNSKDREQVFSKTEEIGFIKDKEILLKNQNGESFWGALSVITTKYKGQEVLLSCINDITKRKEIENRLKKAKEEIEIINSELNERNTQLIKTNLELQDKSIRDSLTSLYNHQYMNERLEEEIKKSKVSDNGLFVIMLDIDHFKNVNDTYGHQVGDWVIVTLCRILEKCIREEDIIGRYGGEEFIVILPRIKKEEALNISECIRGNIQGHDFAVAGLEVTVSIGLAEYNSNDLDGKAMVKRADTLLYKAKENGRNRIES